MATVWSAMPRSKAASRSSRQKPSCAGIWPQLRMARFTIAAMGAFTLAMFFIPLERVEALADISNLFYISGAGIVGAFMGFTTLGGKK